MSPSDSFPPLAIGDRVGGYVVRGDLGHGRTSRIYLTQHPRLGLPLALKVPLTAATADTLRAEGRTLARLAHRHVLRLWDVGEHTGRPFVVVEYADGGSLAGRRPTVRAVRQAARGLRAALVQGVGHGDLAPADLLVCDGVLKVGGFGRADSPKADLTALRGLLAVADPALAKSLPGTLPAFLHALLGVTRV